MIFFDPNPKIFQQFPDIRTYFAVGKFNFVLADQDSVLKERRQLLDSLKIQLNRLATLSQIGSDKSIYIKPDSGIDFLSEKLPEADGMFTDTPNVYLAVRTADCLPILIYNKFARVVAAVHAGWEGTSKKILKKAVQEMTDGFSAKPEDFYFHFGPAAQVCCYEITKHPERVGLFPEAVIRREGDKIFLDFVRANKLQLLDLGVKDEQIEDSGICSVHNEEYPSHRRQKDKREETLLSIIGINYGR